MLARACPLRAARGPLARAVLLGVGALSTRSFLHGSECCINEAARRCFSVPALLKGATTKAAIRRRFCLLVSLHAAS